jgi:hypothetical protein
MKWRSSRGSKGIGPTRISSSTIKDGRLNGNVHKQLNFGRRRPHDGVIETTQARQHVQFDLKEVVQQASVWSIWQSNPFPDDDHLFAFPGACKTRAYSETAQSQ